MFCLQNIIPMINTLYDYINIKILVMKQCKPGKRRRDRGEDASATVAIFLVP